MWQTHFSRVGGLLVIERVKMKKISKHKIYVPKKHILKVERTIHETSSRVNMFYDEPIWNKFEIGGHSLQENNPILTTNSVKNI